MVTYRIEKVYSLSGFVVSLYATRVYDKMGNLVRLVGHLTSKSIPTPFIMQFPSSGRERRCHPIRWDG
jgi:hypothetical protein